MRFENKHFMKETLFLDGNVYLGCRMTDCHLVFGGKFEIERLSTDGEITFGFTAEFARVFQALNMMLDIAGPKQFPPMLDQAMLAVRKATVAAAAKKAVGG